LSTINSLKGEIAPEESAAFLRYQHKVRRRRRRFSLIGLMLALLPLALTAFYVFVVATPLYTAESRFAIRGGDVQQPVGVGGLLSSGSSGMGVSGFVDGYAVRDFLQSREAMDGLANKIDLTKMLTEHPADPLVSLPDNPSQDELYRAYKSLVTVRYNMIEQIVVLQVEAFTPEDSVKISNALIDLSDTFANKMNQRALDDALKVAQEEVSRSEQRSAAARLEVANWRNRNANVDPTGDLTVLTNLIGQLEAQLAAAQTDLGQLKATQGDNPRRKSVETRIVTLRKEIDDTRQRLGGGSETVAKQLSSYESLKIAQDFADTNLASARQSLDQARVAILRQQRYVSPIAQPKADYTPTYPQKLTALGSALLVGLALAFLASVTGGLIRNAISGR
jgi:capsular polysaccharide transport system permease protein